MLRGEAKRLGLSSVKNTRFFAGVYPESLEGAQNDILMPLSSWTLCDHQLSEKNSADALNFNCPGIRLAFQCWPREKRFD
jgi:hypothetical protein